MKIKYFILALLVWASTAGAQTINMRLSAYFYSWQRADSIGDNSKKTTHIRGYQNLLFEFSKDRWSFNTLLQTEGDVMNRIGKGFNYRVYNLYFKGTNLLDVIDFRLGRQYVFAGTGNSSVDGLYLKIKAGKNKEFQLAGYGGALTPMTYEVEEYPEIKDNYIAGGQFSYYGVRGLTAAVSYMNKRQKPLTYTASRLDSLYNLTDKNVETDSRSYQLAGLDLSYSYLGKYNFFGKAYYDLNFEKPYRVEVNANAEVAERLRLSAGYLYREPQVSFNSIFWVFSHKQYQEIEGGIDYTLKNGLNVFGRVSDVLYEDDNSLKFQLGINQSFYGLSYVRYMGYAGESDGVYGYYSREIVKAKLSANTSVGYSNYRIGDFENDTTEKVNSFYGMLGLVYRPSPSFTIDAQGQFILNRIYKSDARFMLGVSYWLFSKL